MSGPGWRVLGFILLWSPTAALLSLHVGLVLFEERGDFGPASSSTIEVIAFSSLSTVVIAAGLPWMVRHDPRTGGSLRRSVMLSPRDQHFVVAVQSVPSMLLYMTVIEPAGGRRVALSILVPVIGLALSVVIARWSAARRPPGQRVL